MPEGHGVRCFPGGVQRRFLLLSPLSDPGLSAGDHRQIERRPFWVVRYFSLRHFLIGRKSFLITQPCWILTLPFLPAPRSSFWAVLSPSFCTCKQWGMVIVERNQSLLVCGMADTHCLTVTMLPSWVHLPVTSAPASEGSMYFLIFILFSRLSFHLVCKSFP